MTSFLAYRVKDRRKELKLSQAELAEGICKQGQISRLEKGDYNPGSELLYKLAKKLKVSMEYFFDEQLADEKKTLDEFKKIAKIFINQRDYASLKHFYELEKKTSHRLSLPDKIYLEWVASLIDFYCDDKKAEAIIKLENVLVLLDKTDNNYLQISNTLFNFYYDTENLERVEMIREELSDRLSQLTLKTIEELELSVKINYNLGRYFWLQNNIDLAIEQLTATIKLCQDYRTTYLLADSFLLLGNLSQDFSAPTQVKSYFETAHFLYKNLEENKEMMLKIEHYMADNFKN